MAAPAPAAAAAPSKAVLLDTAGCTRQRGEAQQMPRASIMNSHLQQLLPAAATVHYNSSKTCSGDKRMNTAVMPDLPQPWRSCRGQQRRLLWRLRALRSGMTERRTGQRQGSCWQGQVWRWQSSTHSLWWAPHQQPVQDRHWLTREAIRLNSEAGSSGLEAYRLGQHHICAASPKRSSQQAMC